MPEFLQFTTTDVILAGICLFLGAQLSTLATTVYLHRALAHKAVKLHPSIEWANRLVIWLMTGISPRDWAGVHRKHHKFSDLPGDPHSPYVHGFWNIQLWNVKYYKAEARDRETIAKYTKDIEDDRWEKLFAKTELGLVIYTVLMMIVFTPIVGFVASLLQFGLYIWLNASINGAAHWIGYQNFANSARNLWVLSLFTAGEGLHNNHHEFPGSPRFSQKKWEIDFGWWFITALEKLGLAKPVRSAALAR